jgi:RND family efflux transporter MFP subunit
MRTNTIIPTILVLATMLAGCSEAPEEKKDVVRPVLTIVAETRETAATGFTGTVEAALSAELGFQLLGLITTRTVDVGDLVHKGQVLATLDTTSLQFAVEKASADLDSAKAKLDLAKVNEERQRRLVATNAATKEGLEEAVQSREAAEASVEQLNAVLTKAREQLGYATLTAENDGVVSAISAEVGQVVTAGQTVLTVAGLEKRDAVVDIPDSYISITTIGTPFDVTLQSDPKEIVHGVVREVAPPADAATRTLRTKIALDSPPATYRLGSMVTATPVAKPDAAIWLPASAVGEDKGTAFVWIVDAASKKVSRRPIKSRAAPDGGIYVLSGVERGERVVTAGVHSLSDNQLVRLSGEAP